MAGVNAVAGVWRANIADPTLPCPATAEPPMCRTIALIGDYDPAVTAHRAIPDALALARVRSGAAIGWEWIATPSLGDDAAPTLERFSAVWCVPASPYANTTGAISAIRVARVSGRPFLGTCGGFQHALIEYALANWGVQRAAHAELDPMAADPVIAPLACSLVEAAGEVRLAEGSRLAAIYGTEWATEGYHCRYGLSPAYARRLETGPLRVAARDAEGDVRAVELDGHPFFVATLYQPERAAIAGRSHPLIEAYVAAIIATTASA